MTEQKQPHEGKIWRKQGPFDWCRIDRNETPEAEDYYPNELEETNHE